MLSESQRFILLFTSLFICSGLEADEEILHRYSRHCSHTDEDPSS